MVPNALLSNFARPSFDSYFRAKATSPSSVLLATTAAKRSGSTKMPVGKEPSLRFIKNACTQY